MSGGHGHSEHGSHSAGSPKVNLITSFGDAGIVGGQLAGVFSGLLTEILKNTGGGGGGGNHH